MRFRKNYPFINLLFIIGLFSLMADESKSMECLPTCSTVDGRFLTIAGPDLSTIVAAEIVIDFVSDASSLTFGIFDGDGGQNWDSSPNAMTRLQLRYDLYADPNGDGSGLGGPILATWSGDGSIGLNMGMPMENNGWSDFTFDNVPEALAPDGSYIYVMRITPINMMVAGMTQNVFKIRTSDILFVPAFFPMSLIAPFGSQEDLAFFAEDINVIYPDANFDLATNTICGLPPGEVCDQTDPTCCLNNTTYDGTWSFFMNVTDGETALDIWDGDMDYGDFDGTVFDTDDPNTPGDPFIPSWAVGTDVVFETARPAIPPDNNGSESTFIPVRDPSVQYFIIDPMDNSYQNFNPSGDREWELFRLDTETNDPAYRLSGPEYSCGFLGSSFCRS